MGNGKVLAHGSLFSGIGGFDLAAEKMGWENKFHCEWNEFGQKVLKYYWPKAVSYGNIIETDFTIWRGRIDILTGGFPCQPYSTAGKRKGKEDERHLWPEMLRAVKEVQPRWVVGENVHGIISWNGGLVFHEVQTELEAEGYEVFPYVLPASGVNAPHRRNRVWFVAHKPTGGAFADTDGGGTGHQRGKDPEAEGNLRGQNTGNVPGTLCGNGDATHPTGNGHPLGRSEARGTERESQQGRMLEPSGMGNEQRTNTDPDTVRPQGEREQGILGETETGGTQRPWELGDNEGPRWEKFQTQPPICDGDDGLSARLDTITFPKWRKESIKGGGNAIVPQVALQIFKAIEEYESIINNKN